MSCTKNAGCQCSYCQQTLSHKIKTGLLLGYSPCCVLDYAIRSSLSKNPTACDLKKQQLTEELYSKELDWFEARLGWGTEPRDIEVYVLGRLRHDAGLDDFRPCHECQHIFLHAFLEGRNRMGLGTKNSAVRAASLLITNLRKWRLQYEPSKSELRMRFSEVPNSIVNEVLEPYKKRVQELLCKKHTLDRIRFSCF